MIRLIAVPMLVAGFLIYGLIAYQRGSGKTYADLTLRAKQTFLEATAMSFARVLGRPADLEVTGTKADADNDEISIMLRSTDSRVNNVPQSVIEARLVVIAKAFCKRISGSDMYKANIRLSIDFHKPDDAYLGSINVSKRDCTA